jgi:hypothetical protein
MRIFAVNLLKYAQGRREGVRAGGGLIQKSEKDQKNFFCRLCVLFAVDRLSDVPCTSQTILLASVDKDAVDYPYLEPF